MTYHIPVAARRLLLAFALVFAKAATAHACACCSSDGQRSIRTEAIRAYTSGVLSEIRFGSQAHVYAGESDVQDLSSSIDPSVEFRVTVTKSQTTWEMEFKQADGAGGKLIIPLPQVITRFEIDPRDPQLGGGLQGPLLYKEWRLTTRVAGGDGLLRKPDDGAGRATFILHGRGNNCTDASQFNAWTLVLPGLKAELVFFGNLSP